MTIFLAAVGLIIASLLSLYGWGRLVSQWCYAKPVQSIFFNTALGLAAWVFIGGLLNAFSLAFPLAINTIFVVGLLFAGLFALRFFLGKAGTDRRLFRSNENSGGIARAGRLMLEAVPVFMIIAATSYFIVMLLPAGAFNHHDDFYKYLPRLGRILQSGTLGGSPFDYVGSDSLGAQSFLQSFIAVHFPLQYINGFDAVFCFMLAGFLLNDIGRRLDLPWYCRSFALVFYVLINPQYVNISALYSGSLMILALIYASFILGDHLEKEEQKKTALASIPLAIIGAALSGLKHTMAPFTALYFVVFFVLSVLLFKQMKKNIAVAGISALSAVLLLIPWFWAVSDKLMIFFAKVYEKSGTVDLTQENPKIGVTTIEAIFSSKKLFYGGSGLEYSLMVLFVSAAVLWAIYLLWKREETPERKNLIIIMASGVSAIVAYVLNVLLAREYYVGIRYSCPVIIAVFPVMVLLFGKSIGLTRVAMSRTSFKRKLSAAVISLLLILAPGITLLDGWLERLEKMREFRTMLSYKISPNYLVYNRNSFSKAELGIVRSMQSRTEEDATILSWFDTSFWLDFKRNRIFNVSGSGNIRAREQLKKNSGNRRWLHGYLKGFGVRYVIWGYRGVPKEGGENKDNLAVALKLLWQQSRTVYDDGRRVVFEIE